MVKSPKKRTIKRKKREGPVNSKKTNKTSRNGGLSLSLSKKDLKEMKDHLIRCDKEKLGFDDETAKKWANKTIKILKEVAMET